MPNCLSLFWTLSFYYGRLCRHILRHITQMLRHTVALYVLIQSAHHRPSNNALVPMQVRYLASAFHYESTHHFAFFIRRLQVLH